MLTTANTDMSKVTGSSYFSLYSTEVEIKNNADTLNNSLTSWENSMTLLAETKAIKSDAQVKQLYDELKGESDKLVMAGRAMSEAYAEIVPALAAYNKNGTASYKAAIANELSAAKTLQITLSSINAKQ